MNLRSLSPCAKGQFSPSLQEPCRNRRHIFVFWRFGADRSSLAECAYLHVAEAHLPRSKNEHIFVFSSCAVTAVSLGFPTHLSLALVGDTAAAGGGAVLEDF